MVVVPSTDDDIADLDPERRDERHLMRRRLQLTLSERRAIVRVVRLHGQSSFLVDFT